MRLRFLLAAALLASAVVVAPAAPGYALDDGLALTPPMGLSRCDSDQGIRSNADKLVSTGLRKAGYEYVILDTCWALPQRDAEGNLVPDPARFPNGIKTLADYVHGKGLKFGLASSPGTDCGHEQQDADLFASWGVDYLRYDNCGKPGTDVPASYAAMRDALKATGRPIVFSIAEDSRYEPWEWAADKGHLWRTGPAVADNWSSVLAAVKKNMTLAEYAGPGRWNDPGILQVGNGGMTATEYRSHLSLWAVMAAPLLVGADLRTATPATLDILGNAEVTAVDQDPLGKQGTVQRSEDGKHILVKPLASGELAVALFNETDVPARIATTAQELGLAEAPAYRLRDLWAHSNSHTAGTVAATLPPHGSALFRVGLDRNWPAYAPAVDFGAHAEPPYTGAPPLAVPGGQTTVTTTVTNSGLVPLLKVDAGLTAPNGWRVVAVSTRDTIVLPGKDRTFVTTWKVEPPAHTTPGTYELPATVRYRTPLGAKLTATAAAVVVVPPPAPPAGVSYLSGIPWLKASNGWGPIEIDQSNGENGSGDGKPLTIGGVVYARGLGVHAPSSVMYHTGGQCSTVQAAVGIDDEEPHGTVVFQVWADDQKVVDTGVVTQEMPALPVTADVSGATLVTLVATDGGDGTVWDHADWADARITCG